MTATFFDGMFSNLIRRIKVGQHVYEVYSSKETPEQQKSVYTNLKTFTGLHKGKMAPICCQGLKIKTPGHIRRYKTLIFA